MLETSARLLRLLSLFQGRRYWSGADLASRLEITSRTLRRDVDKLRQLGYPVHSTSGAEGGYQIGAGSTMPPLLLDDEEAVAVAIGLSCAASGSVQGVEAASIRALAKINQILPPRLNQRVAALQQMVVSGARSDSPVDAGILTSLAGACRDQLMLSFSYQDHKEAATTRTVEPFRLVHTGRRWYLVAWDQTREAWRTFRLDRMVKTPKTGVRFTPREPPSKDLFAYVSRGWWSAAPLHARVRLLVPANVATARIADYFGLIEPIDDETCWFDVGASTWEHVAMHLVLTGFDFEVIEPPELLEQVRLLAGRLVRAAVPVARASSTSGSC